MTDLDFYGCLKILNKFCMSARKFPDPGRLVLTRKSVPAMVSSPQRENVLQITAI